MLPPPPVPRLVDEMVEEILLRLPPNDPGCLFRASLVCKSWRSLLTSPRFRRRYGEFHRAPPMLGFLEKTHFRTCLFFPTTSFCPPAPYRRNPRALDARHGRVLFEDPLRVPVELAVWEPITGGEWSVPMPQASRHAVRDAAVLCARAMDGCDHLDCHGGPFLVVLLYTDEVWTTSSCVYSSEAGAWSNVTSLDIQIDVFLNSPSVLVGSTLYFGCNRKSNTPIPRYDLLTGKLSVIQQPVFSKGQGVLMKTEDGALGFAGLRRSSIYLFSRDDDGNGALAWVERGVIKLAKLLPTRAFSTKIKVVGFAEGVSIIFLSTYEGFFTIELKSGSVRKVSTLPGSEGSIIPYMSFCTPGHARGIMPPP